MQGEWIRRPNGDTAIVFVHGILSSSETAWTSGSGAAWPDLVLSDPMLTELGVYVVSYQTGVWSGSYSISDVVDALAARFEIDDLYEQAKLVFVCHSMGGVVVRRFIIAHQLPLAKHDITIGLFLVSSPSLGSSYADFFAGISALISHAQLSALQIKEENSWLVDLDRDFLNLKESGEIQICGRELIEDKPPAYTRWLGGKQIVPRHSANRYFGKAVRIPDSDHFSICKPVSIQELQHELLRKFVLDLRRRHRKNANGFDKAKSTPVRFKSPSGYFEKKNGDWKEYDATGVCVFIFEEFSRDSEYIVLIDRTRSKDPGRPLHLRIPVKGGCAQWTYPNPMNWTDLAIVVPDG